MHQVFSERVPRLVNGAMSLATPTTHESVEFTYHHTLPESALPRMLVAMFVWTDAKIDSKPITTIPTFGGKAATGWEERLNFRMFDCSSYSSNVKP
jgi:hypothetical protein